MRHKCQMAAIETEANAKIKKEFHWTIKTHARKLRALCITGEQETVCIKHKVGGWDQLGSLELKEEMSGYLIVRHLSSVQRNSCVWHHPQSEKCERC